MNLYFSLLILIAVLYYILREMRRLWIRGRLPKWTVAIGGLVAWVFVLSFVAWGGSIILLLIRGFAGDLVAFLAATSAALFAGFVLQYRQMIDLENVTDFVKESLAFRNYERRRTNIFGEAAQRDIDKVHKEMQSDPKKVFQKPKTTPHSDPEKLRREAAQLRSRVPVSPHLQEELKTLGRNETTEITDSWRLNCLQRAPHGLATRVVRAVLDPASNRFAMDLSFENLEPSILKDHPRLHRFKQDLYDFLNALIKEPWFEPYSGFARTISCSCFGTTMDSFGLSHPQALLRIDVTIETLRAFAERLFDVRDLQTTILYHE